MEIDWRSTLTRAIGQRFNQVYLPRGVENSVMTVWKEKEDIKESILRRFKGIRKG